MGVEWSLLPVGTIANVGDELQLEISNSATPCKTQIANFSDGRFQPHVDRPASLR